MTYVDRQVVKFIASLHRVKDLHTAETKSGKRVINLHTRRDWDLQQKEKTNVFSVPWREKSRLTCARCAQSKQMMSFQLDVAKRVSLSTS